MFKPTSNRPTKTFAFCSFTGVFLGFVYANINGTAFIRDPHNGAISARPHAALYLSHHLA